MKNEENAQIKTEQKYIELNSFRLPIGIYTEKCTYYSECTRMLSDSELEALAREELEKEKPSSLHRAKYSAKAWIFPPMKTAAF